MHYEHINIKYEENEDFWKKYPQLFHPKHVDLVLIAVYTSCYVENIARLSGTLPKNDSDLRAWSNTSPIANDDDSVLEHIHTKNPQSALRICFAPGQRCSFQILLVLARMDF